MAKLTLGDLGSTASTLVDGGDLTIPGEVNVGNTSHSGRYNILEVRSGSFTSSDSANGIRLSINSGTANKSALYLTGGISTVERLAFGRGVSASGSEGILRLDGAAAALYVGGQGIVEDSNNAYTYTIDLFQGVLGADANWSSSLDMNLAGDDITVKAADASDAAYNIALGGSLSGAYGFTKSGTGTLTLSGANTYSGDTTISAGTLALSGSGSIGGSPNITVASGTTFDVSAVTFSLASGQTLGGNGTVDGAMTIASGGTVAPGTSVGILTANHGVTFESGSTYEVEIAGTEADRLDVAGAHTLALGSGTAFLSLPDLATATGDLYIIATAEVITGRFNGHTADSQSLNGTYWIHYVRDPSGVDHIHINRDTSPTSSGIDLRAYHAADGVYVEFVAYDVEADGTIRLVLVDDEDHVLWSGFVDVTAGPRSFARIMVPGLELGQSYHFKVRDEVGKWWDADGVTVGRFDTGLVEMTLAGLTLAFDSLPEREYDIQWTPELGGDWQTITNVTATAEQTRIVVEHPHPSDLAGFFRVQIK